MVSQGGQVLKGMGVGTGLVLIVYVVVMTMIYGLDATRQLQGGIGPGLHWGAITCDPAANSLTPALPAPREGGDDGGGRS